MIRLFSFIASFILTAIHINAQQPALYAGTKTPYRPLQQQYTPPPEGYAPVFVNYVGRHGARFLTRAGSDALVLNQLLQANKSNGLTSLGKRILAMAQNFSDIQKNNYENITQLGQEEQQGIGARLLVNYKGAFTGKGLQVITTHKVRTQQSARALLKAFATYPANTQWTVLADSTDTMLRFYDCSPAYLQYKKSIGVKRALDSLQNDRQTKETVQQVCGRLFTPVYKKRLQKQETPSTFDFVTCLYDVYCAQLSIRVEMQQKGYAAGSIDFGIAFTKEQLQWLSFMNGAEDFIEKGAGADTMGIQVLVATPLLQHFISSTEAAIDHRQTADAVLRFTHAEAIAPFATLLDLSGANRPASSIYQYSRCWSPEAIIPLSANIQWIVYSNGHDHLLKVLLNEKESTLPLPAVQGPYYKWEDLRNYYLKKLQDAERLTPKNRRTDEY